MTEPSPRGLSLSCPDRAEGVTGLEEANALLLPLGVRVWPCDLSGISARLRALLDKERPTDPESGWIVTYGGGRPHIGSLSKASAGTKLLVQVIGPPLWTMRHESEN